MKELETFQDDVPKRTAVKAFMVETLKEMSVQRVLAGESVVGLKEAFELVDTFFEKLDSDYGTK